ncbi:WcaI family glycosyltransferase [Pedobacter sp. HMWF019]|uniref:WcaI family glycosyltransferase n=1 Tax=Pedobacter sp. HMWF019 TaxID=2056856 RepID=UPI00130495E5|nr:WcaI family glycosyltransferase [Pedobacter sp. HMWF019]
MKNKRILVIGINCFPELTGIGKYTGEMLNWLGKEGYQVTMITSFPYYPQWRIQAPYKGKFYAKEKMLDGKLTLYRCPMLVPSNPSGLKRMIHEASFFLSAFFVVLTLLFSKGYEEIFCVAPPFHLGFLALFYRFFKGGRITYHIQDLQVDAAKELKMLKSDRLFSVLFAMERFILNRVNTISTISEGMRKKIQFKTERSVRILPNWVDTIKYYPIADQGPLKAKWGFSGEDKVVLYSGSIGEKQGLSQLIHLAEELKEEAHLKFVICGTGPYKEKLEQMAIDKGLKNVCFFPLQKTEVFNDFLNMADVHLILQKADAGDLMLPSKLTTILAVGGLVLVTALPGTSLYDVIHNHQVGIVIEPERDELLRTELLDCLKNDHSHEKLNARKYAELKLEQNRILESWFK